MIGRGSARLSVLAATVLAWAVPCQGAGQTFQGRVVSDRDDTPVAEALVSLVDSAGKVRAMALADSAGRYTMAAPAPGTYRLQAARIGFEDFRSPLLSAAQPDGVYPVDVLMHLAPVAIPGLSVETERVPDERVRTQVQLMIGLSPASLRYKPVTYDELQHQVELGHGLVDAIRWTFPGIVVRETRDGPCFSLRGRGCLPVFLNGLRLNRDFMVDLPLDMVYSMVVLTPTDGSMTYGAGAVLLYTEAWLR